MAQKIHYRDNCFFISVLVKSLEDGFSVDIDPELFATRIESDINYLDAVTRHFLEMLERNGHLMERLDHLKNLYSSIRTLRDVLDRAVSHDHPVLTGSGKQVAQTAIAHLRENADRIHDLLVELGDEDTEAEVVSHDEMSELLRTEN